MYRTLTGIAAAAAIWALPAVALADSGEGSAVSWTVGGLTLCAAVALLLLALELTKVAGGSAIADNVSYIIVACLCLSASVLAGWAGRFLTDRFAVEQSELGAQLLVIATMAFLCIYFYKVRTALQRFLTDTSAEHLLAKAHTTVAAADPVSHQDTADA